MKVSKKDREEIYKKYNGRCAYCGCILQKGWHIDELLPVKRNWIMVGKKKVFDGTCEYPERFNIDNQMPSCPSCNINKHSMSLENFRKFIKGFIISLNRDSTQYKIAKRYGLVIETNKPLKFYFENNKYRK